MLAHLTTVEPDVLLRVLAYVPVQAVYRLSASCRLLNELVVRNELLIRSRLNIHISFHFDQFFGYSHRGDIRLTTRKNWLFPYASYSFIVNRKSTYEPNKYKTIKLLKKLGDGVDLFKFTGCRGGLILVPDNMSYGHAIKISLEAYAKGFRFDKLRVRGNLWNTADKHHVLFDVVTNWLVKSRQRIDMLALFSSLPTEDRLATIMLSLGATSLEVCDDDDYTWSLTSAFFRSIKLRRLKAVRINCQITDEDLTHFDQVKIDNGQTALTASGILAWVQRKLTDGNLGDQLMLQWKNRSLVDTALVSLKHEYEFFENPQGYFFFRGTGGRWLEIRNRFLLRIVPSYASCLINCKLRKEIESLGIELRLNDGKTLVKLGDAQKMFVFEFMNELPAEALSDWILLDHLSADICVYEKTFHHFHHVHVVHSQREESEALRLLGKRLNEKDFAILVEQFGRISCEASLSDVAADALLDLCKEWSLKTQLKILNIRGLNGSTETKIQRLFKIFIVENDNYMIHSSVEGGVKLQSFYHHSLPRLLLQNL